MIPEGKQEWVRWAVNLLIVLMMALSSWAFTTHGRVTRSEERIDQLMNSLDRIERKLDSLIDRHVVQ